MIKTIPKKKKYKKAKWLSEKTLQIAVKRREAKSKGEKETYSHLNAEFQRIARRDKKAFLSNKCKEIEENKSVFQKQQRLDISTRKLGLKKVNFHSNSSHKTGKVTLSFQSQRKAMPKNAHYFTIQGVWF